MTYWKKVPILLLALLFAISFMPFQPMACTSGADEAAHRNIMQMEIGTLSDESADVISFDDVDLSVSSVSTGMEGNVLKMSFEYLSEDGLSSYPCGSARVDLWISGDSSFSLHSTSYADGNGIVAIDLDNGTYFAIIWASDWDNVRVFDPINSSIYHWTTDYFHVDGNTTFEMEISSDDRAAWSAYSAVLKGAAWLENITRWERDLVTIEWPLGDWPQCDGDSIEVPGSSDGESPIWNEKIILHEYAHAIHYAARGNDFPSLDGPDIHYVDSESSGGFALVEGWAEFFAAAVSGDPYRNDGTSFESTVYADGPHGNSNFGDWDGNIVEGAVANVLWDILDGTSSSDRPIWNYDSSGDQVDNEFDAFWQIFIDDDPPEEMVDVWTSWENRTEGLMWIFRNARFDLDLTPPLNPTDHGSSHDLNEMSDDSTIDMILHGAVDGGGSIAGFSILWDNNTSSVPDDSIDMDSNEFSSPPLSGGTWYLHVRAVDSSGNVANETYHVGPFLISEEAVDVATDEGGHIIFSLTDVAVLAAIIAMAIIMVFAVSRVVRRPTNEDISLTEREKYHQILYQGWGIVPPQPGYQQMAQHPFHGDNFCPHCGKKDLHGAFCAFCGKRLR
ncbi:MAG: zinc ribbon domain-containing protein [Euryarchaeota archaeon]|nr:zinc ribbon domain-containing protein [Euryarchaeota archaeon]